MSDNDEKLAQFQSITGCDPERAQFYLEAAGWQLDLAMASFYEGDADMDVGGGGGTGAAAPPPAEPAAAAPEAGGRINVLGAGGGKESDSDDSDSEQQAFYAGGSSHSGNVILGPKKKKQPFNVTDVFKAARDAGAEDLDPAEAGAGGSRGSLAFQGGGFKLGSDQQESVKISGPPKKAEPRHFLLKMWRDGFSLDDGELRQYQDPANREFLSSVMTGKIPQELVKEAQGGEVHVDMEDHKEEEYVKPTAKSKPFQGAGNVLGSIAPAVVPVPSASLDPAQAEETAKQSAKVDESKPVANIQVRLADGSRLIVKLNQSATVSDLRSYINTARPQYSGLNYALLTTFPNKEITDDSLTISAAGLVGAAVLQRLK